MPAFWQVKYLISRYKATHSTALSASYFRYSAYSTQKLPSLKLGDRDLVDPGDLAVLEAA